MRERVDILGAGIGGLATAWFLARDGAGSGKPGLEIHIWEKDSAPGGLAGSFETESWRVEKFYHHLFRRDVALRSLIEELGMGGDLVWRPASTGAYYFARPYRLSSPLDLLRFEHMKDSSEDPDVASPAELVEALTRIRAGTAA